MHSVLSTVNDLDRFNRVSGAESNAKTVRSEKLRRTVAPVARDLRSRFSLSFIKTSVVDERASRLLDIIVAAIALAILLPVLLLVALAIWARDGASPIFVHRRLGRGGTTFPCFKFRSMVVDAQTRLDHILETDAAAAAEWARDQKLRNDPRITSFGEFLRKTSLDELPQLANVLRGEMSLVGPRPIVPNEVPRYGRYFRNYCEVKPGITGLWQVSGRNDVSYRRRVALDTVYSRSRSVGFDLLILGRTVPAVLTGRGSA